MSRFAWDRFFQQKDALADYRAAPAGRMVISLDKAPEGLKLYVVCSPVAAYLACMNMTPGGSFDDTNSRGDPIGHYQYELLLPDVPMRLYYDAEFDVTLNPGHEGDRCIEALHHYMCRTYTELSERPRDALEIVVETCHREGTKSSYHGKVQGTCGVVRDMEAQRAFWARVMQHVERDYQAPDGSAERTRAQQLRVRTRHKQPGGDYLEVETWFWDQKVYTKHRLIRMLGASKWPKERGGREYFFVLRDGNGRRDIDFETWQRALILDPNNQFPLLALPEDWHALKHHYWQTPVLYGATSTHSGDYRTHGANRPLLTPEERAEHEQRNGALRAYYANYLAYPGETLWGMLTMNDTYKITERYSQTIDVNGYYKNLLMNTPQLEEGRLRAILSKNAVTTVQMGNALVLPVGRQWSENPLRTASSASRCLAKRSVRELTIDIDCTDYDREPAVRFCACAGKKQTCNQCWYFLSAAALALRHVLQTQLNVHKRNMLWVSSGLKGIHCWVNDSALVVLPDRQRRQIGERYFDRDWLVELRLPVTNADTLEIFDEVLIPHFVENIVRQQALFANRSLVSDWLERLRPHTGTFADRVELELFGRWRALAFQCSEGTDLTALSCLVWERLTSIHRDWMHEALPVVMLAGSDGTATVVHALYWLVAQYAWPRIDAQVMSGTRATLKLPYSVHKQSWTVAFPIPCPTEEAWLGPPALTRLRLPALLARIEAGDPESEAFMQQAARLLSTFVRAYDSSTIS